MVRFRSYSQLALARGGGWKWRHELVQTSVGTLGCAQLPYQAIRLNLQAAFWHADHHATLKCELFESQPSRVQLVPQGLQNWLTTGWRRSFGEGDLDIESRDLLDFKSQFRHLLSKQFRELERSLVGATPAPALSRPRLQTLEAIHDQFLKRHPASLA